MSWFRFTFLLNLLEFCHLVYSFLIHSEMNATHFKPKEHNYLNLPIVTNFYGYICDNIYRFQLICFYFVFIPGFTNDTELFSYLRCKLIL